MLLTNTDFISVTCLFIGIKNLKIPQVKFSDAENEKVYLCPMDESNSAKGMVLANNNALSSYKETRIKTASQGQLLLMLYDEAIKQLDRGLELLELNNSGKKDPGRIEQIGKSIMKTQEIITELMVSLDFEQGDEIAKNLFALYTWFNRELLEANIRQDMQRIMVVRDMMNDLRGAWRQIAAKSAVETANREVSGVNIAG